MKLKTSELIGSALDLAVAVAWNVELDEQGMPVWFDSDGKDAARAPFLPSSNKEHGQPVIDQFSINVMRVVEDGRQSFEAFFDGGIGGAGGLRAGQPRTGRLLAWPNNLPTSRPVSRQRKGTALHNRLCQRAPRPPSRTRATQEHDPPGLETFFFARVTQPRPDMGCHQRRTVHDAQNHHRSRVY